MTTLRDMIENETFIMSASFGEDNLEISLLDKDKQSRTVGELVVLYQDFSEVRPNDPSQDEVMQDILFLYSEVQERLRSLADNIRILQRLERQDIGRD